MGVIEKSKLWRNVGRVLNSSVGSHVAEATTELINRAVSVGPTPKLAEEIPFTPMTKPLSECRVSLVSTAGFYLEGDTPFDVDSAQGDPSYRTIPIDCDINSMRRAHTHYTHRYVEKDLNVLFPIERLLELADEATFNVAPRMYSFGFGGMLTSPYIKPPAGTAHQVARDLARDQVDIALLVPA